MPKGGLHHVHSSAAASVDDLIRLTYDERAYFSSSEKLFKVFPKHLKVGKGFVQCVQLREQDPGFDDDIRRLILLSKEEADQDTMAIWKPFGHKFSIVGELTRFSGFFEVLARASFLTCIRQKVYVVEWRHSPGRLFDEDRKPVPVLEELEILQRVVDEVKCTCPHFEFRLIFTGLKPLGNRSVQQTFSQLEEVHRSNYSNLKNLVAGLDLAGEEEYSKPLNYFSKPVVQYLDKCLEEGHEVGCYFHCGETHNRHSSNIADALLMGTRRIGHGFQLA